jgi:hypothetical protein
MKRGDAFLESFIKILLWVISFAILFTGVYFLLNKTGVV